MLIVDCSRPGTYGHSDWLLSDEALPAHGHGGHRMAENNPAWLRHWTTAELYDTVSTGTM